MAKGKKPRQKPGTTKWVADIRSYGGGRVDFETYEAAEAFLEACKVRHEAGLPLPEKTEVNHKVILWGEFAEESLQYIYSNPDWRKTKAYYLNTLTPVIGAQTPLSQISETTINELREDMIDRENAPGTINKKLELVRAVLNRAVSKSLLDGRLVPKIENVKDKYKGRIRYLSYEEENDVIAWFRRLGKPEFVNFTKVLVDTGARPIELIRVIPKDDITWSSGEPEIRLWETKNDEPRSVPLTSTAFQALQDQYELRSDLFGSLKYRRYLETWKKIKSKLFLDSDGQFVPYALRHTCASRLVMNNVDLRRVQTWMGHKSIDMTLKYAHLAPGALLSSKNALEKSRENNGLTS